MLHPFNDPNALIYTWTIKGGMGCYSDIHCLVQVPQNMCHHIQFYSATHLGLVNITQTVHWRYATMTGNG